VGSERFLLPVFAEDRPPMAYKPASLPPERLSPDATVEEVMAFRRESPRSVFRKNSRRDLTKL
jgi:hypothetical protein